MPEAEPRTVTFYCGDSLEPWGLESLWRGIGGSEEALIHMSRHLSRRGLRVEVFANPPGGRARCRDGVRWVPFREFDPGRPGDVFVAWRDPGFVELAGRFRQVYHWLHNRPWWYPAEIAAKVDRILVVSRHHAADPGFAGVDRQKLYVTSNGLDPEFLRDPGDNEACRAIYASCPARGLLPLLEMWPELRRQVPQARLDVYHGFTAIYDDMSEMCPGLKYIKVACHQLLDQDGVSFYGMVGQDRLAEGFARSGVWLYPTECQETSCITAMKALAMGCLPVTSGCAALGETLGGRDLGPVHPKRPISRSRWRRWRYLRRVVWAMRNGSSAALRAKRLEWARWARARYSWAEIAQDWCRLFAEVDAERQRQRASSAGAPAAAGGPGRVRALRGAAGGAGGVQVRQGAAGGSEERT
jgi:glycosyltransferase involved in cell wall biosynthesis